MMSTVKSLIEFDHLICGDLAQSSRREWLETNGIGGFASSSIVDLNTPPYHGLLTPATKPPGGRFLLLSKTEYTLSIDGVPYEFASTHYAGSRHPPRPQHL